jgi:hypothetical protein
MNTITIEDSSNFIQEIPEIKPADPLLNRKNIPLNPPIFSREGAYIILRPFCNNFLSNEEFALKPREQTEIVMKDVILDLYLNSSKMLQKLVYYKEPIEKDNNRVTVENIINLRIINKNKKKKKKTYSDNNLIFKERFDKYGINYDNFPTFESHFESGNLQLAYAILNLDEKDKNSINLNINENNDGGALNNSLNFNNTITINNNNDEIDKYELFLHNDTNTSGYTQWFFFRVSNVKKGKTLNLNIMNFLRKTTKYSNGIKIWVYSRKNSEINKIGWHHTTEEVKYYKNFLYKLNKGKKDYYYTLSFNYTFQFDNDEVFFANCIPFTYTDLNRDLNFYTKNENDKYIYFNRKKLCSTIIGNEVEYFSINNTFIKYPFSSTNIENKKGVVLFGRQHPSETVGSWTIKGAMDFLLGDSDEANYLRDNFVFKIVPMINVDGVICGNTRTSLSGCDLNRRWSNPNIILHPEIFYTKEMIMNFSEKYKIECIVDFHGHFGAFNSFFYGNYKEDNLAMGKYFPFSCAKKSKVIQFEKSKFKMPKYKRGTGRINLFNELNVENVVTLETSYFGCNSGRYENKYFTSETLQEIGRDICYGILLFHYHSNIILGIGNNLVDYPKLKEKVENDEKIINNQFSEYINKLQSKNEPINDEKIEDENVKNNDNDIDTEGLNDESDSESEPSKDNLEESEILKLMPKIKKLKKVFKKNFKKRKINRRNLIGMNLAGGNQNSNLGTLSLKQNSNVVIAPYKNNNLNQYELYSLPKVKNNSKNKKNFNNELDINKTKKDQTTLDDENSFKGKEVLKMDFSAKNILVKMNPTSPNIKEKKDTKLNLKFNFSITFVDKATQTEEIFFKKKWSYFVGLYKIMFPRLEKSVINCQLKPIKFNNFKNSYSYINKRDNFLKNAIIPPPQSNDLRSMNKNPGKIINLLRNSKIHIDCINEIKGYNNGKKILVPYKSGIMLPFGPVFPFHNNSMDKYIKKENNNNENTINYNKKRYNSFNFKNPNQKFVNNPLIKSHNIILGKIDDKKDYFY